MRKEAGLVNLFPQYITGEVSEIHNMLNAVLLSLSKVLRIKFGLLLLSVLTSFLFQDLFGLSEQFVLRIIESVRVG